MSVFDLGCFEASNLEFNCAMSGNEECIKLDIAYISFFQVAFGILSMIALIYFICNNQENEYTRKIYLWKKQFSKNKVGKGCEYSKTLKFTILLNWQFFIAVNLIIVIRCNFCKVTTFLSSPPVEPTKSSRNCHDE